MSDVYERLRQVLDTHPSGAPKSAIFDRILRMLFSPDEAELAAQMSFAPRTAPQIASDAGMPAEKAAAMLEKMASRVVVFSQEKEGTRIYGLLPTIPGLFEYPLMKGADTPELRELGRLWSEYHDESLGASFAGTSTPLMRVVPIEKALPVKQVAHPYEDVRKLIEGAGYIGLSQCACRVSLNLSAGYRIRDFSRGEAGRFDRCQEYRAMLIRPLTDCIDVALDYTTSYNSSTESAFRYDRDLFSMVVACHF